MSPKSPIHALSEIKGQRFHFLPAENQILNEAALGALLEAGIDKSEIDKGILGLGLDTTHINSLEVASLVVYNWTFYARDSSGTGAIQSRPIRWNWKTKDVSNSTNVPIFADTMWRGGGPCYRTNDTGAFNPSFNRIVPPQFDGQWSGYSNEMMHFTLSRHQTGTNVLFLDWSVRAVGLKELWTLKWHRKYPINGPRTRAGGAQPSDWPDWMSSFKDY